MSTSATSGGRSTRRASGACSTPSGAPGTCSRGPSESARSAALDPHPSDALVHRYSLAILAVIGGLSYSPLRPRLIHDLDTSLLAGGQVVSHTRLAGSGAAPCAEARAGPRAVPR